MTTALSTRRATGIGSSCAASLRADRWWRPPQGGRGITFDEGAEPVSATVRRAMKASLHEAWGRRGGDHDVGGVDEAHRTVAGRRRYPSGMTENAAV